MPMPADEHAERRVFTRLARKNVLAGLFFMAVAGAALWISRDYPIGTAVRMGTGYIPRMLCWLLLLLGAFVLAQGLFAGAGESAAEPGQRRRPLVFIPLSLLVFGVAIERLGLVLATLLLVAVASLAGREFRPLETLVTAAILIALVLGIFVRGLGMALPILPGG